MATDRALLNRTFGDPYADPKGFEKRNMVVWNCQKEFPELPFKKMYVNHYLIPYLQATFKALQQKGLLQEIKTFNGCWAIRDIRGYPGIASIHSWGLAIDFNAADNLLGKTFTELLAKGLHPFSEAFLQVWRDTGWTVGADFGRKDRMHMQRTKEFEKK